MEEQELTESEALDLIESRIPGPTDRDQLAAELERYTYRYLLDMESAVRAVIRDHYSGEPPASVLADADCPVFRLQPGTSASLTVSVDGSGVRVTSKGKTVQTIRAHDSTGIVTIQVWDDPVEVADGAAYRFPDCRISFSNFLNSLVATYSGGAPEQSSGAGICDLFDIMLPLSVGYSRLTDSGDDTVVHARVLTVYGPGSNPRGPKTSGLMEIDGHQLRYSSWEHLSLSVREEVCIDHVKVGHYNGELQLTIGSGSVIARRR